MNFRTWLSHQEEIDHPIGDLARDVAQDTCMPRSVRAMRDHLRRDHRGSDLVLAVFDEAVEYWQHAKRNPH